MSNIKSQKELKEFLEKVDKQQDNGPFNLRDSGIQAELHKKLSENAVRYDNEPVTSCPVCNSLHLIEIDNILECYNCGNEIEEKDVVVYKSIFAYLDEKGSSDTDNS